MRDFGGTAVIILCDLSPHMTLLLLFLLCSELLFHFCACSFMPCAKEPLQRCISLGTGTASAGGAGDCLCPSSDTYLY